ncbi:MAG: sugar ABC transporter ATP-binding protein [Treponema sp.]|nr:sugar ABC transporter ATP-binding protein [Treponema sp.]
MEHISKSFGGVEVLHDVSLAIKRGEIHSIIGENGAGKSTLMKIIGGVYTANRGTVFKNNDAINPKNPLEAIANGIGTVHQELSIADNLTVAQNMLAGYEPVNRLGFINNKKLIQQTGKILQGLGLDIDPAEKACNLSIGMQQVIEIAKVISRDIDVLILDEPTSSLSEKEIRHLFKLLYSLKQEKNITILFISHKLSEVTEISDRVTVLRDGCLIGTLDREDMTIPVIINMMIGRDLDISKSMQSQTGRTKNILEVRNLTSRAKKFKNISFSVMDYEILGLFGLIGSGRTEIAHTIIGADKSDGGEILYLGKQSVFKSPRQAVQKGICYLTEDRKGMGLFLTKPLTDNIVASVLDTFTKKTGTIDKTAVEQVSREYIDKLNIQPPELYKHLLNFSGGNQQKVLLAKALMTKPKVLIVDEPTRGVDVGAKDTIHQILRNLAETGIAIIMISSELPEILQLSDRVAVMHEGSLKGILVNKNLTESKILSVAFEEGEVLHVE